MSQFLLLTLSAWFICLTCQLIAWPIVFRLFSSYRLADHGWAISRPLLWLFSGLIIWFPSYLGLPVNTKPFLFILMGLGLILSGYFFILHLDSFKTAFVRSWPVFLIEELLFSLGFFGLSYIRSFNPAILDLEKFMDAGFIASYLRSPVLPAPDIWLAGSSINYYSFGHFLGSIMVRLWSIPLRFSYNLLLGYVMGLIFILSFSFVHHLLTLTSRNSSRLLPIIGGLFASFFTTVGGNTHTLWYFLSHGNFKGYWYADATRFIDRTIHEFPSYSFVVSDLHAHVWGLPLVLCFLCLLPLYLEMIQSPSPGFRRYFSLSASIGIFMGTFVMASTWDFMIYGILIGLVAVNLILFKTKYLLPLIKSGCIAIIFALLTAAPWVLHFQSISEGARFASEHSPLWQIVALWSGHFLLSLMAFILAFKLFRPQDTANRAPTYSLILIISLALTAWLLLIMPEIIYFKDIYTGHPRANTMFKLTYQAFVMMSLLGGWVIGTLLNHHLSKKKIVRYLGLFVCFVVFISVMLFPYFAYRDYYGALKQFHGLDGWAWLQEKHPDDYQAILWLEQNVKGQPHILESWGESYTTFDRVSAYTGLPTVIGWRVHEWLWRGGFDIAGQRSGEVDNIYRRPLSAESLSYLNQYQVEYIIVGDKEREAYPQDLHLTDLLKLGPVVFQSGNTRIIKYTPQPVSKN